jgi:glycosyltransferase involved in cell wall biosynthesis
MKIKWNGATLDPSGYGSANRDFIKALHLSGVDIQCAPWNFEANPPEFYGDTGKLVRQLEQNNFNCDLVMHHYVPNNTQNRYEEGKINVGYSTWETDKIPPHWVDNINTYFDAQIVPSYYNKFYYERCGVDVPIYIVPHCIDIDSFDNVPENNLFPNKFTFLSVFQWIERKNPIGLLKAYFTEFNAEDDVVLIIKTYGLNKSFQETDRIINEIQKVKQSLRLNYYPKIFLVTDILPREKLIAMYKGSDCLVHPARSEGFGIPLIEACAAESTVITTGYSAMGEVLNNDVNNYFAEYIDWHETPVYGMEFPHYDGTMLWAEPNTYDLRLIMRDMFEEWKNAPSEFALKKQAARKYVEVYYSYKSVGSLFKDVLIQIMEENKCKEQ